MPGIALLLLLFAIAPRASFAEEAVLAPPVARAVPKTEASAALVTTIREQEIAECRSGEIATWNDGRDRRAVGPTLRLAYRHDEAPSWFERSVVENLVTRAARAWAQCGVPIAVIPAGDGDLRSPDTVLLKWDEAGSLGNFGLANLSQRTLSFGPKAFALLHSRNPRHDATQTLQMVISHEMGHFFGLMAHSRRCVDVLSYYHDADGGKCYTRDPAGMRAGFEYRHGLPTACDIERCRRVNGFAPLPGGRLP